MPKNCTPIKPVTKALNVFGNIVINLIIEKYHTATKKRHDLLVEDMAALFPDLVKEDISASVHEIEKIIQHYYGDASDSLYGVILESDVKKKISEEHGDLESNTIEIIFERAKHYASR